MVYNNLCVLLFKERVIQSIFDFFLEVQWNTVNPTTVITTTRMIRHFFFGPFKTPISPMYFYHG